MRLLLDNNLSVRLIDVMKPTGWDVIHLRPLGLQAANDPEVLELARSQERVLVSADTDFGALMAATHADKPSVVLIRRLIARRVDEMAAVLMANLPAGEEDLRVGRVVAIGDDWLRVRRLPI